MASDDLAAFAAMVEEVEREADLATYEGRVLSFEPYAKQVQHLGLGRTRRERLLMAGNRLGKSETGAYEAAMHLTGRYDDAKVPWTGRRFDGPTKGWIAGVTSLDVRNVCQTKLCGQYGVQAMFGSGMIPKEDIVDVSLARGVTDAYDTIQVRHVSGGISVAQFKSYEQGREKFQGEGLDWIWLDEEPPLNVYSEALTRIGERDGLLWMTFTPLEGRSDVVIRFLDEPSRDRAVTTITIDEAPHITPAAKARMLDGYLDHEREARAQGVPMLGSGRIFKSPESAIIEPAIEQVPLFWRKLWAIDFGIGHPFGAVLLAWEEPDGADVIHVLHTIRMPDALPIVHAAAMKAVAAEVPVAYPKDGDDREKGSGEPLAKLYRAHDLKMLDSYAEWEAGGISTDAGIEEWDAREKTGRLKVGAHLADWLEERRFYHRKDGKIVKIKDDLMSATRVGLMAKRFARAVPLGKSVARRRNDGMAAGVDFDVLA